MIEIRDGCPAPRPYAMPPDTAAARPAEDRGISDPVSLTAQLARHPHLLGEAERPRDHRARFTVAQA